MKDAEYMFRMNQDPDVLRFTGDEAFKSIEETILFIKKYLEASDKRLCRWTVLLKSTHQYLGWCGLKKDASTGEVDIGFRFLKEHWNKSFATESAKACIHYGFDQLGLDKIIGRARVENKPSIRVLEKIGLKPEKEMYYLGGKAILYSLTIEDYAKTTEI